MSTGFCGRPPAAGAFHRDVYPCSERDLLPGRRSQGIPCASRPTPFGFVFSSSNVMDSEEGKKEGEVSPSPGARGRGSAICERPGLSAIPREQVEESGAWTVVPVPFCRLRKNKNKTKQNVDLRWYKFKVSCWDFWFPLGMYRYGKNIDFSPTYYQTSNTKHQWNIPERMNTLWRDILLGTVHRENLTIDQK